MCVCVCSGTRVLYIETCDGRCCCSLTWRTDCLSHHTYRPEFSLSRLSLSHRTNRRNRLPSRPASDCVHRQHDSLVPSTSSVQQRRRQPWTSATSSVNLVQLRRSYRHARHYFTPLRSPHCTVRLPGVFGGERHCRLYINHIGSRPAYIRLSSPTTSLFTSLPANSFAASCVSFVLVVLLLTAMYLLLLSEPRHTVKLSPASNYARLYSTIREYSTPINQL